MNKSFFLPAALALGALAFFPTSVSARIGDRFPSEKKIVADPVTGTPMVVPVAGATPGA